MLSKLYSLFSGVVLFATILTALVYIWTINRSTIYERKTQPAPESSITSLPE
jgi:hypothetical protein